MQEIITLPLAPRIRNALVARGFTVVADLQRLAPIDLAREAGISPDEAMDVLKHAQSRVLQDWNTTGGVKSAVELFEKQSSCRKIITFCSDLDKILGGGVWPGQVTELCGMPGIGKTQLGIQLAIDAQIPAAFGGAEGKALYIDTEGSFMVERVHDMAAAAVRHVHSIAQRSGKPALVAEAEKFTLEAILANILYFRIHDMTEQAALLKLLPQLLLQNPEVRLLVIDSITFHYRQDFRDMAARARSLTQTAQDLVSLAEQHNTAVVLMNQVTTKINAEDNTSKLVPALGDTWGHAAATRVFLYWTDQNQREAFIYKSPSLPPAKANYTVTAEGVRGVKAAPNQQASGAPRA